MLRISPSKCDVYLKRGTFLLVMIFSYFSVIYASDFAEGHISFPFLDFPIFVGEVLLFLCFVLLVIPYLRSSLCTNRVVHWMIVAYFLWVMLYAFWGYFISGPLALRNAALFYYPAFALVGYLIFYKDIFSGLWRWVWLAFLFFNLFFSHVSDYFVLAFLVLALGLCVYLPQRSLRLSGILLCVFYMFYSRILWWNGRAHMVGIGMAIIFLAGYFLFGMFSVSRQVKVWSGLILGVLLIIALFKLGDQNALKSMLSFRDLFQQYNTFDSLVTAGMKSYVQSPFSVRIYHDNMGSQRKSVFGKICRTKELGNRKIKKDTSEKVRKIFSNSDREGMTGILVSDSGRTNEVEKPVVKGNVQKIDQVSQIKMNNDFSKASKQFDNSTSLGQQAGGGSNFTLYSYPGGHMFLIKETAPAIEKDLPIFRSVSNRDWDLPRQENRALDIACNNIFFRIFIWRDMLRELIGSKAWWGMGFGHPQRSPSIEILDWATTEWRRDGWITPHNSFFHAIYRAGLIGLGCVIVVFAVLIDMMKRFFRKRSVWGGFLIACLVYWMTISNFLVFLELPYNAIPFWVFFGMTLAYLHSLEIRSGEAAADYG